MSTSQHRLNSRPAYELLKAQSPPESHDSTPSLPAQHTYQIDGTTAHPDQTSVIQMPPATHDSRSQDLSKEDIDEDPQAHFLSPVQMYEAWDDSDDEDGDDIVDWDAGIIDFSLFHDDHKRAKDNNAPLPSKWNDLLMHQAQAFQRVRTAHDDVEPEFLSRTPSGDSLPDLTPDCSPRLQDNLDYDSDQEDDKPKPQFHLIVTPPPEDCTSAVDDNEDDMPLSFFVERGRAQRRTADSARTKTLMSRPGLCDGRTLSGKRHAWQRPYWDLWTIKEGDE